MLVPSPCPRTRCDTTFDCGRVEIRKAFVPLGLACIAVRLSLLGTFPLGHSPFQQEDGCVRNDYAASCDQEVVVLWDKRHAIQSAGMEDGLLDVVVVQLVVRLHNQRRIAPLEEPRPQQIMDTSWTMIDASKRLSWDFGLYD